MRFLFLIALFLSRFSYAEICESECRAGDLKDVAKSDVRAERLSTKCAKNWEVKSGGKKIKLPAGLRVMRLDKAPQSRIVYHLGNQVFEGLISEEAFTGKKSCKESEEANVEAFLEEASFAIDILKDMNLEVNSAFMKETLLLEKKIKLLKKNAEMIAPSFKEFSKEWKNQFIFPPNNKVLRVERLQGLIAQSYDPVLLDKVKMSKGTLVVPISQNWMQSIPKLKKFYQEVWLDSKKDIRISVGQSGEGLSYSPDNSYNNDSYLEMVGLLNQTEEFIKNSKDPQLLASDEYQWLVKQKNQGYTKYRRMIFFSPATWDRSTPEYSWAEFIPVDQSLGGLHSDHLLSVMLHEINVNSNNFMLTDTHGPYEQNAAMWECLKKNGMAQLSRDSHSLQYAFGLNPQLSMVYIKMVLDQWEKQVSSK